MSLMGIIFGKIGYFNHMRNYPAKAEKFYRLGMKHGGMSPMNEGTFGVLLLRQGKFEEALEHFDGALAGKGGKPKLKALIRMNRSIALFKLGRSDEAVAVLEGLHKSFRSLRVYQTLGYLYVLQGAFEKAEPYNLEACEYDPEDAVILDNTGQMYMEMGQLEKAKGYIERAYAKKHISDVLYHMGLIAESEGRPAAALEYYREALDKSMDALNDVTLEKIIARIGPLYEQLGITGKEEEI
jgi:tetratricopeptide (TPR) repeat protein